MEIDDETAIGKTRVETNHCVHTPAADTRQPVAHELLINFIDFILLHGSIHGLRAGLHCALFRSHFEPARYAVDCGEPIYEIVVMLTKAPNKDRELAGQK